MLDRKSESDIKAEEEEKERQFLNGKVVWQDEKRKLFFEGEVPVLIYKGERYHLGCEPHEPMLIIEGGRGDTVYVHNAHKEHWQEELQNAFDAGKRMAEKIK